MSRKKLIEVSIPLQEINKASATEKSLRHMHPSTLHLWWSRKPLATTRAVLWASLVDDPEDKAKRKQLHNIMSRLVKWDADHVVNPQALADAKAALPKDLPDFLDPFAGGGSIPLEAQRLGLNVHSRDLNPIAVMLNKAMTEIPPKFAGMHSIHPDPQGEFPFTAITSGGRASGLADDVKFYGRILREKAFSRIGSMYPLVQTTDGEAVVIAWLWARTVKCPNPACGCDMPLVSSFTLSTKHKAYVVPHVNGQDITYTVAEGTEPKHKAKIGRGKFQCVACGAQAKTDYLHEQFSAHKDGKVMLAVVAEGKKGRLYLNADDEQVRAADVPMPEDFPDAEIPEHALGFRVQGYGFMQWHQLFTNRQLTMLTTLCDILPEVEERVRHDAVSAGLGEESAKEYAEAVGVYLAFAVDKLTIFHSSLCPWNVAGDKIENCFGRQALPMIWDYAEGNPFSDSSGCFSHMLSWIVEVLEHLPACASGEASQHDAMTPETLRNVMVSTDPPYYDNIGYADLSDYFYIWMRRNLRHIYPSLFRPVLVPKSEELIATPYRHDNDPKKARKFFEDGMLEALRNIYACASDDYPVTIYYAYKQKETEDDGVVSNGWEAMLNAVIDAGFTVIRTWPIRTERPTALKANVAALGSSVVLVCRKRPADAPGTTRQKFMRELRETLRPALEGFLKERMSPVDVPQSAIGPGMSVYSKYSRIVSTDGKVMSVREALSEVNAAVDELLGGGELDAESRFCVDLYRLRGFGLAASDDALKIATARNVALDSLKKKGLIVADGGKVHLTDREELAGCDESVVWTAAQKMVNALETGGEEKDGIASCGNIAARLKGGVGELSRELVYYLYTIADGRKWSKEAYMYNNLVNEWEKIQAFAYKITLRLKSGPEDRQITMNMEG